MSSIEGKIVFHGKEVPFSSEIPQDVTNFPESAGPLSLQKTANEQKLVTPYEIPDNEASQAALEAAKKHQEANEDSINIQLMALTHAIQNTRRETDRILTTAMKVESSSTPGDNLINELNSTDPPPNKRPKNN